jgi:hypothetical protein
MISFHRLSKGEIKKFHRLSKEDRFQKSEKNPGVTPGKKVQKSPKNRLKGYIKPIYRFFRVFWVDIIR